MTSPFNRRPGPLGTGDDWDLFSGIPHPDSPARLTWVPPLEWPQLDGIDLAKTPKEERPVTAASDAPRPDDRYESRLRGEIVELRGIRIERIAYTKRDRGEWQAMRRQFDARIRAQFLKEISRDAPSIAQLKRAGLTEEDIALMRDGGTPLDWEVHHRLPLDDNGGNDFSNLVLIYRNPHHRALTYRQMQLTKGMTPGTTRTLDFPVPAGNQIVYPVSP